MFTNACIVIGTLCISGLLFSFMGHNLLGAVTYILGILFLCNVCFFGGILAVTHSLTTFRHVDDKDNAVYIVLKLGQFEYRMKVKEQLPIKE